jgi:hypothetical protein
MMRFQDEVGVPAMALPSSFVESYDRYYEDGPTDPDESLQLAVDVVFAPGSPQKDPKIIKVTVDGPGYDVTGKLRPHDLAWLVKIARSVQGLPRRPR